MLTKQDGLRMATDAINQYEQQVAELEREVGEVQTSFDVAKQAFESALVRLATFLLPSCEMQMVQRVATDLGATILPQRVTQYGQQRQQSAVRLAQIDVDPRYTQRLTLLHPTDGTLSRRINELRGSILPLQQSLARFELSEFQWLVQRNFQNRDNVSGFQKFWNAVTLVSYKENKAWEVISKQTGHTTFEQCVGEYNHLSKQLQALQQDLSQVEAQKAEIFALLDERIRHEAWVNQFEHTATDALRKELVDYLRTRDWNTFHKYIRPEGRAFAAECHALINKAQYYHQMIDYLHRESDDRKKRIQRIDTVRQKWAMRPHGYLAGDKSKWLSTIPAMKQAGTDKRLRWVRSMRRCIHDFNDYEHYAYAMNYEHFYPYDAFDVWSDERLPHEGFAREILPELDQFRNEHGITTLNRQEYRETAQETEAHQHTNEEAAAILAAEQVLVEQAKGDPNTHFADVS